MELNNAQKKFLKTLSKCSWWEKRARKVTDPAKLIVQVMNIGTRPDVLTMLELFPKDILIKVLIQADESEFTPLSWNYWHNRLLSMPFEDTPHTLH